MNASTHESDTKWTVCSGNGACERRISPSLKNFRISLENDKTLKDDWILKTKIGFLNAGFCEGTFKNKKHSEETKKLMSESSKGNGVGETNSQYGTCWITKDGINKKIKKEDLETYQLDGWVKGRK